ncbi:hypothetical protein BU15DRAFT_77094 [Melanogaster broomeanus]|nr:hypothetical protein BU15DRAFT_77094 [Melanogaster broomeanus]
MQPSGKLYATPEHPPSHVRSPASAAARRKTTKTAAKKAESAEVEESRDGTRRECKRERDASSQGRVERRDRRGKVEARWVGEQTVAATGLGEAPRTKTDVGTRRARDTPPKPQTASQTASEAAADAANPNATSAGPTGPAGASCKPQDAPHGIADDSARGQGQEANEGVEGEGETSTGRTGEEITAAKGPGEGTADQTADGISLAAPASSPNDDSGDEDVDHTHVAPNETHQPHPSRHRTRGRRTTQDRAERAKE